MYWNCSLYAEHLQYRDKNIIHAHMKNQTAPTETTVSERDFLDKSAIRHFLTVGGRQKKGWWQLSFSWSPFQGSKKVITTPPPITFKCLPLLMSHNFFKLTLLSLTFKYCQCTWLMDACNISFPKQRTLAQVHCKDNFIRYKDSGDKLF